MNRIRKPKHHGQSLVEFALIIPILLLLAIMIFDFGRAIYYYSTIHNAAREGARFGVIHPNDDIGMINTAENYAIGLDDLTITAGWENSEQVGDNDTYSVSVTVRYCFIPVTPLVEIFVPEHIQDAFGCDHLLLTSNAVMRTEVRPIQ